MACITPNPRRVGIYGSYTWASRWASIHGLNILQQLDYRLHVQNTSIYDVKTNHTVLVNSSTCAYMPSLLLGYNQLVHSV